MKSIFFIAVALCLCVASGFAYAIAGYEAARVEQKVVYADKTSVEMICKNSNQCAISVNLNGVVYDIPSETFGKTVKLVPNHLLLMRDQASKSSAYTIQFEIGCDEYAELPPIYYCVGSANMNGNILEHYTSFKRFYRDSYRQKSHLSPEEKDQEKEEKGPE